MNNQNLIKIEEIEHVGIVSFIQLFNNNRDISNLVSKFQDDLNELELRSNIRIIIFTGFENIFSYPNPLVTLDSNIDISNLRMSESIASIKLPSLALLNGNIFDHALELALATDIRISSNISQFRMGQLLSGNIPWDGGTQRLPKIVGKGRALEMTLTCREINAEEALSTGLVSRIMPDCKLYDQSINLAKQITLSSPIAVKFLKESIMSGLELHIKDGLKLEADLNFLLQNSFDRAEGLRSFLSSETPEFRGE